MDIEKKKEKTKPQRTSKYIQPSKLAQVFTRFMVVTPRKTRKLGYKKTIKSPWGTITVSAVETPITRDLKVFLAIITYIYENQAKVKEFHIDDDTLLSIDIDMYSFVTKYLHKTASKELYSQIEESINILSQMHISGEYTIKHNDETVTRKVSFSLLPKVSITTITRGSRQKKTVKLVVYKWAVNMLSDPYSLFVDNYYLQQTGTRVSTLLCLFLMSQTKATSYSTSFLVQMLGLEEIEEDRHLMRELKNAFQDLQKIGYITSWHIEKRRDDTYFVFSRKPTALKDKA